MHPVWQTQELSYSLRSRLLTICALVLLAFLTYLPALSQPFIEDDYPLIAQASAYGSNAGWASAFANPVNRPRLTSLVVLNAVYDAVGMNPAPYYVTSICLHALNALLVFALGAWDVIGYRTSAWAAAFFVVYEGHHEAVMWISANNELLLFFFGLLSVVCWIRFLQASGRRWLWYGVAIAAYVAALLSKESAVILLTLLAVPALWPVFRLRALVELLPFLAITAASVLSIAATRQYSGHFRDGSFSVSAPFVWTWINSYWRLFWIWGVVALLVILVARRSIPAAARVGFSWAAIALLPYVFLTYNTRVPSRHTYLASAGVAIVVACAFVSALENAKWRRLAAIAAIILVVQNAGWIWTRKRAQFLLRAEPTQQLVELARRTSGPIYVRCFPRAPVIAEQAVKLTTGRRSSDLVWTGEEAERRQVSAVYCFTEPSRRPSPRR